VKSVGQLNDGHGRAAHSRRLFTDSRPPFAEEPSRRGVYSRTLLAGKNFEGKDAGDDQMNVQELEELVVSNRDRDALIPPGRGTSGGLDTPSSPAIEVEMRRMELDLQTARDIQRKLLPSEFPQYSYLEVGGVSQSCHAVGGDYFDVVKQEGNRAAFVVADVAGKGLSAALLTALLQGGLIGLSVSREPTRLISQLNSYLWAHSDTNRYATAIVGDVGPDGVVEYVNAGHQPGLVARQGEVREVLKSECFPIGMFPGADFRKSSARLDPDDTLILFSDGLSEAQNGADEEFGMGRLRDVLAGNSHLPAQDLSAAILSSVAAFSGDAQQTDDITLLVLRYKGEA
jgi:sigma-B regulation protein RsbU (phosphoserine phosphatase)